MEQKPLVSIIIITYNSSEYVVETLDSALSQTYPNVEIIVTDDCSTDKTIAVCRQWISDHMDSGKPITLVESEHNTGVSGNCNRGFHASHGEWIKVIAGDDILAPTSIESYIEYVFSHQSVRHLVAKAIHFEDSLKESDMDNPDIVSPFLYRECVTAKQQYDVIRRCFFGSGPTYFIQANALKAAGGYDERFPMQEDYPLFIKMIGMGYKMEFLDKVTVYKRVVKSSLQYDRNANDIFSKNMVRMIEDYKYHYREEVLGPIWRIMHKYSLWIQHAIVSHGNSYKSWKCRLLRLLHMTTDPFVWYARYIKFQNKRYLKFNNL